MRPPVNLNALYTSADAEGLLKDIIADIGSEPAAEVQHPWHERCLAYVAYPNAFGPSFDDLAAALDHIAGLGCNTLHVLPFFRSPRMDMGFDVADYEHVDSAFGGDEAFLRFLGRAHEFGLHVVADLILNHLSDQHPWAREAAAGVPEAIRLFIHSVERPELLEVFSLPGRGQCARYRVGTTEFSQRVIFPDQAGALPHWRQLSPGGPWFYHTFYPHQLDLDWSNPEVFRRYAKILGRWARQGVSFRLDAIPFIGRDVFAGKVEDGTDGSTERTLALVRALREVLALVCPSAVFLAEAMQPPEQVSRFLEVGADLAYEFHLCMALWATLLQEDASFVWRRLRSMTPPAAGRRYVLPLRTHDSLFLEYASRDLKTAIAEPLARPERWQGAPPKVLERLLPSLAQVDALQDIPGRAFSFLGKDSARLVMAFLLQASLPGCPLVYQGDEMAQGNDFAYMLAQSDRKRELDPHVGHDLREIGRAPVQPGHPEVQSALRTILRERAQWPVLFSSIPSSVQGLPRRVFGADYSSPVGRLVVLVNLAKDEELVEVEPGLRPVLSMGGSELEGTTAHLAGFGGLWLSRAQA